MNIIEEAKQFFYSTIPEDAPITLKAHLEGFGSTLGYVLISLENSSVINEELVRAGMWLHDCGHYPLENEVDHAIRGEDRARSFLKNQGYNAILTEDVCHCVRAHRNNDVKPTTPEAKLIAGCDSLTHLIFAPYVDMVRIGLETGVKSSALEKLERDWRDICSFLPKDLTIQFSPHYRTWKNWIELRESGSN
ncbi:HD domain-containing protein [Candidatus Woesearchaeota archaeon]|jgi:hypothetical protein|nr:HD domain-containing protein [Candidatus Woesearchaeota archaeon]MBT4367964.1 HD domain-containing protein [Candidatus Woesearchaeota archaeon]MBT4712452.1 HD domain-containing protein [Candidatus Woesearchaeota archaeon]MBT6639365.1 HD domain-containing protein [Candidatus Woesearchaeota archaeon]MBT7133537.1 HD domain-containing protein [Candidatus Woesearchaeota archaeon]